MKHTYHFGKKSAKRSGKITQITPIDYNTAINRRAVSVRLHRPKLHHVIGALISEITHYFSERHYKYFASRIFLRVFRSILCCSIRDSA